MLIFDILEYQYPGISKFLNENIKIEKKKRKILVYLNGKIILTLNPKFGLFIPSLEFAQFLKKIGKYIEIKEEDIDFIKRSKNVFKINVKNFSENLEVFEDFALVSNNKIVGIGKTKINFLEFSNSKRGLVAKIRKV